MLAEGRRRESFWYWAVRAPMSYVLMGVWVAALVLGLGFGQVWALWGDIGFAGGVTAVNLWRIRRYKRQTREAWARWEQRNGGRAK